MLALTLTVSIYNLGQEMQRTSAVNATMLFLGLLALGPVFSALVKRDIGVFLDALPAISQAIGGLLAILATYQIAKQSDERMRKFEDATAEREARFDERAEARSARADLAADARLAKSEKSQLRRQAAAEARAEILLIETAIGIGEEAITALDRLATQSDTQGGVYDSHVERETFVAVSALDAISRSSTSNASLLLQIQRLRHELGVRPSMQFGTEGRTQNGTSLRRFNERLRTATDKLRAFKPHK